MYVQHETILHLGRIAAHQDHGNEKLGEADKQGVPVVAVFWLTSQLEHITYPGTMQLLIDMMAFDDTFEDAKCVASVSCSGSQ